MKKKVSAILASTLAVSMAVSFTACSGKDPLGDKPVGDRTQISFLCENDYDSKGAWEELVAAYNDGAGYETDGVFVNVTLGQSANANSFTKSVDSAYNVVMVADSMTNSFVSLAYTADARKAPEGYMLKLDEYANADTDFQSKYNVSSSSLDWWRLTRDSDARQGAGQKKHVIGAGQNLLGVPIGTRPHFNWYNQKIFVGQGINIVSVPEEDMEKYNADNGTNLKPHGYAEYKTALVSGMVQSENLEGQSVYKVFNNCIGMNWEEQRNFLKYFSPNYNKQSPTDYGFVSEYWFNYGWSVGGDVMGFNGTSYDFTLMDKSANYIVTKNDTKINNVYYKAGEIVRYEDRVNQKNIADMGGVYPIESTYNAVKEYVSLQVATDTTVDTYDGVTYNGYGVADPNTGAADTWFNKNQLAMVRGSWLDPDKMSNPDFDLCPAETYREYEGGSVYYSGGTGFADEHLRVIGETYDDLKTTENPTGEYTGELKVVDGTPIIGNSTTASISKALVVPACSDPAKYQAAWDFISWVATEGQKYLAKTTDVPVSAEVLFSDAYAKNAEISRGKNLYAIGKASINAGRGDWAYFENGQWVTNWSNMFNEEVRLGTATLSRFEKDKSAGAKEALDNMYCVIKGIR